MTSVFVWAGAVIFGGVGSVLRFLVDRAVSSRLARPFPYGTLAVNLTGAAILGFLSGLTLDRDAALVAGTGLVGAYTTFSTWIFETHRLTEERQVALAAANLVVSIVLGVAAAAAGLAIGTHL